MGTGNDVIVFDEYVPGEEGYVSPPPPAFDGPGGLPEGWSRIEVVVNGKRYRGFMSDKAAVIPVKGGFSICPVMAGALQTSAHVEGVTTLVFDDYVAAIVAAEMVFPRRR